MSPSPISPSPLARAPWRILRSGDGRYSVHPAAHDIPAGWEAVGEPAPREACLTRIAALWTDMRPAALRDAMNEPAAPCDAMDEETTA
ncbi:MbtH family protein [Celeribacter indicus]|uniref:MbtH-like protein n=1 Tax=Celeribacter indicus TaxID=1208324 RepID=A0A0B5DZ60_9RHOB|nr:MbtH family NRPS accessory protein [Celeribacter indicus]AJE48698.1 mbtH-like protein [Celeribacter indicus]SDX12680.1 MbtH protein [Celeribacter indicus]